MLSVIIPAFNAEKYIGDCIRSITSQISRDAPIHIIVVVDGATDGTLARVEEVQSGHENNVRIICQENYGACVARNTGVSLVKTKYTTFLDADDTWSQDYVQNVLPILHADPSLVEYDACFVDKDDNFLKPLKISRLTNGQTGPIDRNDFLSMFRCYAWARVYRTQDVLKQPFPEGRRFEDTATTPWFYWNSDSIVSIAKPLVRYRQHPHSILATPSDTDISEIAECVRESIHRYRSTGDQYWLEVAYRTHHFACNRIARQPISTWLRHSRTTRASIAGTTPPHISGAAQLHCTPLYVALIKLKRMLDTPTSRYQTNAG